MDFASYVSKWERMFESEISRQQKAGQREFGVRDKLLFLSGHASLINLRKKQSNATLLSGTGETPQRQIGVSFLREAISEKPTS
jgi:hypothetical protein